MKFFIYLYYFINALAISKEHPNSSTETLSRLNKASDYKRYIVNKNETKTVYYFFNLSGKVYYKIRNRSGSNALNGLWVKGPFGTSEPIGKIQGNGSIPFMGILWGKLKVSGADSETTILITENSVIATTFPSIKF